MIFDELQLLSRNEHGPDGAVILLRRKNPIGKLRALRRCSLRFFLRKCSHEAAMHTWQGSVCLERRSIERQPEGLEGFRAEAKPERALTVNGKSK